MGLMDIGAGLRLTFPTANDIVIQSCNSQISPFHRGRVSLEVKRQCSDINALWHVMLGRSRVFFLLENLSGGNHKRHRQIGEEVIYLCRSGTLTLLCMPLILLCLSLRCLAQYVYFCFRTYTYASAGLVLERRLLNDGRGGRVCTYTYPRSCCSCVALFQ